MRRGRIFFYIGFIIILVLVGLLVAYQTVLKPKGSAGLFGGKKPTATPSPVTRVYIVINGKVSSGYTFTENDFVGTDGKTENKKLQLVSWPKQSLTSSMFTEEEKANLIGRMVKFDIDPMMPVLDTMLLGKGEMIPTAGSVASKYIDQGMVAVSIPMSRLSAVSYAPRPGDYVNVIVTMAIVDLDTDFQSILPDNTGLVIASGPPNPESKQRDPLTVAIDSGIYGKVVIDPVLGQAVYVYPSEGQRPRLVSQLLIQDAKVLQLGDFLTPAQEAAKAEQEKQAQQRAQATQTKAQQAAAQQTTQIIQKLESITLVVYPQDAVTLNYLMFSGAYMTIALRAAEDHARVGDIQPVTLQYLLEHYQIPVPVKLPYGLNPRIDFPILPTQVPEPGSGGNK